MKSLEKQEKHAHYAFKIVIIGGGGVGKTCLFNRYCFNSFDFNTEMTIGVNFHSVYLPYKNFEAENEFETEKFILNSIFDFGGQDRFKPLIPKFLRGADGALLLFDSVSYNSFEKLDYWHDLLMEHAELISNRKILKFLIGCKSDLIAKSPKNHVVNEKLIIDYMREKEINGFYRTSSLENYNVLKVFNELTKRMLENQDIFVELL